MAEIFYKHLLMFLHFCENSSNVSVNANSCYMQFAWALSNHAGDEMLEAVNYPNTKCMLMPGVKETMMSLCYLTTMPVVSVHEFTHSVNFYSRL